MAGFFHISALSATAAGGTFTVAVTAAATGCGAAKARIAISTAGGAAAGTFAGQAVQLGVIRTERLIIIVPPVPAGAAAIIIPLRRRSVHSAKQFQCLWE